MIEGAFGERWDFDAASDVVHFEHGGLPLKVVQPSGDRVLGRQKVRSFR